MKTKLIVAVLVVAFIMASCVPAAKVVPTQKSIPTPTDYPQSPQLWKGVYKAGFEIQMFTPCGATEGMWVEGKYQEIDDFISKSGDPTSSSYTTEVYVEIQADVSPPGNYGDHGMFRQQINVIKVIKVQYGMPYNCH
jgi:hypothetical protein